jgi:hypothetical protein
MNTSAQTCARLANAMHGMTDEQKLGIRAVLDHIRGMQHGASNVYDGVTIYREPSTLNPPRTVKVRRYGHDGVLMQEWIICEQKQAKMILVDGTVIY